MIDRYRMVGFVAVALFAACEGSMTESVGDTELVDCRRRPTHPRCRDAGTSVADAASGVDSGTSGFDSGMTAVDSGGGGGNVLEISGTISASEFLDRVNGAPAGALVVRPASGGSSFTVTGDFTFTRAHVTLQRCVLRDVEVAPSATGLTVEDCHVLAMHLRGTDDVTWQRNTFDGECLIGQNFIMPGDGDDGVRNFRFIGNTFQNYHVCSDESIHSEALFIGGWSDGGVLEGNTFIDNGTTGHLFFTWWGGDVDNRASYAHNICVRSNTFIRSINGWYHIQFRGEFDGSENVDIDPSNTAAESIPGFDTALTTSFLRPCD